MWDLTWLIQLVLVITPTSHSRFLLLASLFTVWKELESDLDTYCRGHFSPPASNARPLKLRASLKQTSDLRLDSAECSREPRERVEMLEERLNRSEAAKEKARSHLKAIRAISSGLINLRRNSLMTWNRPQSH